MKTLTCSDAGFDCAAVIKGETVAIEAELGISFETFQEYFIEG